MTFPGWSPAGSLPRRCARTALSLASVCLAASAAAEDPAPLSPEAVEFFESRIRPVLAQDCYSCHSQAEGRKGGLLLDSRPGWEAGGRSGPAILPGRPDGSLLVRAIRHEEGAPRMPREGAPLDPAVVRDFVRWIEMGAPDPRDHPPSAEQVEEDRNWEAVRERRRSWWSFQPIGDPLPPAAGEPGHPVDAFLEARRREQGLQAAGPAPAEVLARRFHLILIGLPPDPGETLEFVRDHREDPGRAVSDLVDRLLASPRFGERWARHWMDWIRYAESHGSEGDPPIGNAHLYRDYLIRALNADVPYDQLVREHVAGDLLEEPRIDSGTGVNESLIGTAHWRMVFHGFAPTDALDERVRFTDDQINVFSKAFLGLTVSCARCHDHKFDPLSQRDYHALFSILGSTRPGRRAIETGERQNLHRQELLAMKPALREAIAADWLGSLDSLTEALAPGAGGIAAASEEDPLLLPLKRIDAALDGGLSLEEAWAGEEREQRRHLEAWEAHRQRRFLHRWRMDRSEGRGSWFGEGAGLGPDPTSPGDFSVAPEGDLALSGIHCGGVHSHLVSTKHAARLASPDFPLEQESQAWLLIKGSGRSMSRFVVQNYPRSGTVFPIRAMQGEDRQRWRWERYPLEYWTGDDVHLELAAARDAPLQTQGDERSWFAIREAFVAPSGSPPPPSFARTALEPVWAQLGGKAPGSREEAAGAYRKAVAKALRDWTREGADDAQAELLDACLRLGLLPNRLEGLPAAGPLVEQWRELEAAIPVATRIPALSEWKGQDLPLFERGDHRKPRERVPRRFLEIIDETPYQTGLSGRLRLAEDVLRPDNPLARRVIVNRIWHHLFGRGLVATPDNFGRLGEPPSHPLLLDHLASRFESDHRWSIKRMIRYLATSRAFQLDGRPPDGARRTDPGNVLLSHFSIRRLEAEAIRDSMLFVAGVLDPAAPDGPVDGREPRRSVYVRVLRNRLDPFLSAFDAPVPFSAHGRRHATNVPAQSLALMNGDLALETAASWGGRLARQAGSMDRDSLIRDAWMRAFASRPSPEELELAREFLEEQEGRYRSLAEELRSARDGKARLGVELGELEALARERWAASGQEPEPLPLEPLAEWLFDADGRDSAGSLHLELVGAARVEEGALVLPGGDAYARSAPLAAGLKAKTLEVRLRLDALDQGGGGAISVQKGGGAVFDAIVYGERRPGEWIAGSDGFRRTEDFPGAAPEARLEEVHLAVAYHEDGTIRAYRNGRPYGGSYRTSPPVSYPGGGSEILLGLRHGEPGGNRMLRGRILEARLYDRALSAPEAASASGSPAPSREQLLLQLGAGERERHRQAEAEHARLSGRLQELEERMRGVGPHPAWSDLALSMFNLKEFIYVR